MKTKNITLAILVIAIGATLARMVIWKPQSPVVAQKIAPLARVLATKETQPPMIVTAAPSSPLSKVTNVSEFNPAAETSQPAIAPEAKTQSTAPQVKRLPKSKPEIQDPAARVALSFVGMSPEAEDYWIGAINDSTLPAEERKDLIEDLNEDGLSDPHHPTAEDMTLIASRIELIEGLAPYAADEVNARAFAEAHKDLVNLWNGRPAD